MGKDTEYFAVLENGCVALIEITDEMKEVAEKEHDGIEDYFYAVVCDKYNISVNNCEWMITCSSQITVYGQIPQLQ